MVSLALLLVRHFVTATNRETDTGFSPLANESFVDDAETPLLKSPVITPGKREMRDKGNR